MRSWSGCATYDQGLGEHLATGVLVFDKSEGSVLWWAKRLSGCATCHQISWTTQCKLPQLGCCLSVVPRLLLLAGQLLACCHAMPSGCMHT